MNLMKIAIENSWPIKDNFIVWTNDITILQKSIYYIMESFNLFEKNENNANIIKKLFDDDAILYYWVKCFTDKNYDMISNNETYIFLGKKLCKSFLNYYCYLKYKNYDKYLAKLFYRKNMNDDMKKNFSHKYFLYNLCRYNSNIIVNDGNIFDAFLGCLYVLIGDKLSKPLANIYIFNIIVNIFNNINLEIIEDPVNKLHRLSNYYEGILNLVTIKINKVDSSYKSMIINEKEEILMVMYDNSKYEVENKICLEFCKYLEQKNIEYQNLDIFLNDPEMNKLHTEINQHLNKLNVSNYRFSDVNKEITSNEKYYYILCIEIIINNQWFKCERSTASSYNLKEAKVLALKNFLLILKNNSNIIMNLQAKIDSEKNTSTVKTFTPHITLTTPKIKN